MTDVIWVHMACNNPLTGDFRDKVKAVSIQDTLDLSTSFPTRFRVDLDSKVFWLSGKKWPFVRHRIWVGNYTWNAYALDIHVATEFLTWLCGRDLFGCDGGRADLVELWENRRERFKLPDKWWIA